MDVCSTVVHILYSKYNIITSQLHRFMNICSERNTFLHLSIELINYLYHIKHYKKPFLYAYTKRFLSKFYHIYGSSPTFILSHIFNNIF